MCFIVFDTDGKLVQLVAAMISYEVPPIKCNVASACNQSVRGLRRVNRDQVMMAAYTSTSKLEMGRVHLWFGLGLDRLS